MKSCISKVQGLEHQQKTDFAIKHSLNVKPDSSFYFIRKAKYKSTMPHSLLVSQSIQLEDKNQLTQSMFDKFSWPAFAWRHELLPTRLSAGRRGIAGWIDPPEDDQRLTRDILRVPNMFCPKEIFCNQKGGSLLGSILRRAGLGLEGKEVSRGHR